ncbi:hypothetical protein [Runella sp.]|uniref:hypothetical protein n=1 Tax=Runella sp. TaxID=1960881 RepID=UPI003D0C0974
MEELITFLTRNKSTHFNIKDSGKRRVAYHEGNSVEETLEALRTEYPELPEGAYTLHAWKGSKSAVIDRPFKIGQFENFNASKPTSMSQTSGNSLQVLLAEEREKGRQEALKEMRIQRVEDFITEEIKPILSALKELATLDIKTLREGIEALKNDDPDDDEDAIDKLEKFQRGTQIVKSLMSKTA